MRRFILDIVFLALFSLAITSTITPTAQAAIVDTQASLKELMIGNKNAPVTIIEYASLGCPHCANFHKDTYPLLKKHYIDTGKVKMIYRDFPLGASALAAAMISRCAGPKRRLGMIDLFYRSQAQWGRAQNPLQALTKVARFGGLTEQDVKACIANQELIDAVRAGAEQATTDHNVQSTPSFIINGELIAGNIPFNELQTILDKALN